MYLNRNKVPDFHCKNEEFKEIDGDTDDYTNEDADEDTDEDRRRVRQRKEVVGTERRGAKSMNPSRYHVQIALRRFSFCKILRA